MSASSVCLIGFGEVGQILAHDLLERTRRAVRAWDVLFADPDSRPSRAALTSGVYAGRSLGDAVQNCEIVISAVTASRCAEVAADASAGLKRGTVYLDLNSVSPGVRVTAAQSIASVGGCYVEGAVMAPVAPKRIATAILLGGPHAAASLRPLRGLGFEGARFYSEVLGRASAAKMCRSVLVKGLEALLTESLLVARHYQVEQVVLDSLGNILPGADWHELSRYMISRSLRHGQRRAEEMREAADTVREAGLPATMSEATATRQGQSAVHAAAAEIASLESMLDRMLGRSRPRAPC